MQKALFLLLISILLLAKGFAQFTLQGRVTVADGKPVPAASVFLSNTSFGTAADANGQFVLVNIPAGRYELIVSSMGFETQSTNINTAHMVAALNIVLKPKAAELEEVVIGGYERETWEKWGRFFFENFIGTTNEASQCTLKNHGVIRFKNYTKKKKLVAVASEPLILENRALGYRIKYQMELFEYDFKTKILLYAGYPLFEPMEKPGKPPRKKWVNNREKTYYGSKLHFMRSLYRNTLIEEGFEMRYMTKVPNTEKERVRQLIKMGANNRQEAKQLLQPASDSSAYYQRVLKQPDMLVTIDTSLLTGDSIAFEINETTAGLFFPNFLHIIYTKAFEDPLYVQQQKPFNQVGKQTSSLQIISGKRIEVLANGAFFDPLDVLMEGYWSWSDKMANMLPFDYNPKPPTKPQ